MTKLPILKAKELVKALNKMGFFEFHRVGSHAQFKHQNRRKTTIPIHSGRDIHQGTLKGILESIEISSEEFIKFLKK